MTTKQLLKNIDKVSPYFYFNSKRVSKRLYKMFLKEMISRGITKIIDNNREHQEIFEYTRNTIYAFDCIMAYEKYCNESSDNW